MIQDWDMDYNWAVIGMTAVLGVVVAIMATMAWAKKAKTAQHTAPWLQPLFPYRMPSADLQWGGGERKRTCLVLCPFVFLFFYIAFGINFCVNLILGIALFAGKFFVKENLFGKKEHP